MPVTFAEDATGEEAKADVTRVTPDEAQARRGPAPVSHYWSLLLLLPETEQGHAPRAVGVDAVVPHRVALHE